jgi:acyl carrier protein phosphodiesterase
MPPLQQPRLKAGSGGWIFWHGSCSVGVSVKTVFMNFLAHLYLSGQSKGVLIGNFIGDSVKGKQYLAFAPEIRKGIWMHRQIDSFTDSHAVVRECAGLFRPSYGRYAGIVTDVVFDHFLAKYWEHWSCEPLPAFAGNVHALLLSNYGRLPAEVRRFLPYFIAHRRLESYAGMDGIGETLRIMGKRTSLPEEADQALHVLREEFFRLKAAFDTFFPELIAFVEHSFGVNIQKPAKHRLSEDDVVA